MVFSAFFTGTYINLQDAYAVEANAVGAWDKIGYTGPGNSSVNGSNTNVFRYVESESAPQWSVTTLQKLNDCGNSTENAWTMSAKMDPNNGEGQSNVLYKAGGVDDCYGLTPSFKPLTSGRSYSD